MMINKQRGYTLMELVVVLSIVGLLATVALPSFSQQIKESRLSSNSHQLHSIFKYARSEAVKREKTINLVVEGTNWLVKLNGKNLISYIPSHSTISVSGLNDITISETGLTTSINKIFTISDNDNTTTDYSLCIYSSGQSKTVKGSSCA